LADAIRRGRLIWLLVPILLGTAAAPAAGYVLPPGFQARVLPLPKASGPTYVNGLQKPSTLDFAPDGTMFVAERNGRVLAFDSIEDSTPTLVANILDEVHSAGDRGVLGMKLHPEYPDEPYLYLSYTYEAPIGGDSDDSTFVHNADGSDGCETSSDSGCLVSGRLARIEINPTTDVAVGGAEEPPQDVLINSWCQQKLSHSIGDIEFDSSGALLMTGGDGASYSLPDYGQLENPCGDPTNEGGALRSQDVRTPATAGDPTDYSGSLIRIDRETAVAPPENPFVVAPLFNAANQEDVAARRIIAYGMRNPFRFAVQPGSDRVYIGDVGWELWEEINELRSPPPAGQGAVNFGWPCYEGGPSGSLVQQRYDKTDKPLCESLYATAGGVKAPLFAYPHPNNLGEGGQLFSGDACNPKDGSAVAGLAFYDGTGVDPSVALPEKYDGALFFTDAARGCIWTMEEGPDGRPDPSTVENFWVRQSSDTLFTPVEVVQGPDNALYVPNFYFDQIVQIRYFPGNQAPTVKLTADKTFGQLPLKVKLDASGSSDPDTAGGDKLNFAWDLDGDGQFDDGIQAKAEPEYTEAKNVTAKVRVSDNFSHVEVASVTIYPGDKGPPSVTITKPAASHRWEIGEDLEFAATATDPDGEELGSGPGTLTPHWEFTLEHCPSGCHDHFLTSADTPTGTFEVPEHEYPAKLRLEFTATDSRGLTDTESVEISPRLIEVGIESDPAGIPLTLNGVTSSDPISATAIAGGGATVSVPETATVGGEELVFSQWSDGGPRIHDVTSSDSVDLVAHFVPKPDPEPEPEKEPELEPKDPDPTTPSGGGGGSSGSGSAAPPPLVTPPPVTTPALAQLRLVSRPPGVRLGLGTVSALAPFSAELEVGSETFLRAPRVFRRQGNVFRFKRWISLGASRRQSLTVSGDARYVAVYGRR
jgi:glucose/arabinose dehydrogenase